MDYSANYAGNIPPETAIKGALWIAGGMMVFMLIFAALFYVYFSWCIMRIAKKTNTENAWLAWIPVFNIFLLLNIAKKPSWWFLLFFVPFVNIVISIIVWMEISKSLKKPEWLGILIIVPIANIVLPGYLAFSETEDSPGDAQADPQQNELGQ